MRSPPPRLQNCATVCLETDRAADADSHLPSSIYRNEPGAQSGRANRDVSNGFQGSRQRRTARRRFRGSSRPPAAHPGHVMPGASGLAGPVAAQPCQDLARVLELRATVAARPKRDVQTTDREAERRRPVRRPLPLLRGHESLRLHAAARNPHPRCEMRTVQASA